LAGAGRPQRLEDLELDLADVGLVAVGVQHGVRDGRLTHSAIAVIASSLMS
jgi:hypothetical protein